MCIKSQMRVILVINVYLINYHIIVKEINFNNVFLKRIKYTYTSKFNQLYQYCIIKKKNIV